jgi:GntR family transcriptional regulator / MocR family aminotransferase
MGVHPNTALAALKELANQGWLEARPRCGYFVADPLPISQVSAAERKPADAVRLGFDLPVGLSPITDARQLVMDLTDGSADARLAPMEAMSRAYQRALKLKGAEILRNVDFKGLPRLRKALAEHLSRYRAIPADVEGLMLVPSTSMAVDLVTQALVSSAEGVVVVESPGNPMVWEAIQHTAGSALRALPVDEGGISVEALESLLRQFRLQLLVITPQAQYPTGVSLLPDRRRKIMELSRQFRFPILELDSEYDHLSNAGRSMPPLAAEDPTGQILYVGSLSRSLAPAQRLGYLLAPSPLTDRLARVRRRMDFQGDALAEWALSELLLDGEFDRHLRRMRKATQERKTALQDALRHSLGDRIDFDPGTGAMALWVKGIGKYEDPRRFSAWIRNCGLRGIKLRVGKHYDFEGQALAATRLGFTAFQPEELQRAIALMA